jgi:hypothetical protein
MCLMLITPLLAIPGSKIEMPGIACDAMLSPYGAYSCSLDACWRIWIEVVNPEDGSTVRIPLGLCEAHLRPYTLGQRDCGVHHEPFEVRLAA